MRPKSKSRFTLKIIGSYLALGLLVLLAGIFIYSEFKDYTFSQNKKNESAKLLKTNTLLAELYEAENLSKLALQTKKRRNLKAYSQKVDSIFQTVDTLKLLAGDGKQIIKLDSVQALLQQKVYNNAELRKLKVRDENNAPLDSLLQTFQKMEVDLGRITPENFVPDFNELPEETQKSIREYVALLNKNIPQNTQQTNSGEVDSILQVSKTILEEAKIKNAQIERSLVEKELEIYKTDLELSQKLRSIVSAFEQEIIMNAYSENLGKQQLLKKSSQFVWATLVLGLIVISVFTFLITGDYWKVQLYRKRLEKEKRYSESLLKSREQLISMVSHDLRTPLNTIKGHIELMELGQNGKKSKKYFKNITSASDYVENLVNRLLDFSKLESGKMQVENVPFMLSKIISDTIANFEEVLSTKSLELNLEVADALKKPILGDPYKIRQILTNLIGNALKFTNEGFVKVNANTKEMGGTLMVFIQVIDSGIGIPKEKQELVFKEFTQVGNPTENGYYGHGLGLTISKKLAKLLGGDLTLKSKENEGSTFTAVLPLQFAKDTSLPQKSSDLDTSTNLSIAALDDEKALLQLLTEMCSVHGIHLKTFTSYDDLEKDSTLYYDVLLTDIQMPKKNGFKVVETLKSGSVSHYKNQPIIAMTGQRDLDKNLFSQLGFAAVLQKPFSKSDLLKTLGQFAIKTGKSPITAQTGIEVPEVSSKLFSLDSISSFLDSPQALHEVLETFLETTEKNMELLSRAITDKDVKAIKAITHRMLPMFRQLKVESIVPLLEQFEHIESHQSFKKIRKNQKKLQTIIFELQEDIRRYLAIPQVGID